MGIYILEVVFFESGNSNRKISEMQKKYFWAMGTSMLTIGLLLIAFTAIAYGVNIWLLIIFFIYLSIRFLKTSYESFKSK